MAKILVVFHSITGHTMDLAKAVAEGVKKAGGNVTVKRVEETIPERVLEKNPGYVRIKEELKSFEIAEVEELPEYDGIVFGSPTRFGNMSAQMKTFLDKTGSLWVKRSLSGKVAGVFQTNEMLHGGKEATLISMLFPLFAHGMIIVGLPPVRELYQAGSYYGATSTGTPDMRDMEMARLLGERVAEIAERVKGYSESGEIN